MGKIKPINSHGEIKDIISETDITYPSNFDLYPSIEDQQKAVDNIETTDCDNNIQDGVELKDNVGWIGWLKGSPRLW